MIEIIAIFAHNPASQMVYLASWQIIRNGVYYTMRMWWNGHDKDNM